jgi:hypothetical protein
MSTEVICAVVACTAIFCIVGLIIGHTIGFSEGQEDILSLWRKSDLDTALRMQERELQKEKLINDPPAP